MNDLVSTSQSLINQLCLKIEDSYRGNYQYIMINTLAIENETLKTLSRAETLDRMSLEV